MPRTRLSTLHPSPVKETDPIPANSIIGMDVPEKVPILVKVPGLPFYADKNTGIIYLDKDYLKVL